MELLLEGENILSAISTAVQDAIIMIDNEGKIIFWNNASVKIFGYTEHEVIGKNLHELLAPDRFRADHRIAFSRFQTSGKGAAIGKTLELYARHQNGLEFPIELSLSAIQIKNKWHAVGVIHDITERKKVEHELRKLSQAVEQSPVSIVITNLDGNIEYVNQKAGETTGYTKEELIGKNPRVLKSGETQPDEYEFLWSSITSGKNWKGIFHNKRKNGELYWESSTIAPIKDIHGQITNYIALKEDITERRLVEKALQDSEALLRSFFDLPLIGHAITSPVKGWLEINSSLCNMLGYTKSELMPLTWDKLTHPDDLAADMAQFTRVLNNETDGYSMEKRFIHKDGHVVFTHLAVQCKRHADHTVDYFMAVVVDISDIKRAEEEIRRKNEDLVRANAEKDKFFSIIAHDLRSPFGAFLNLTKIMAEEVQELSLNQIQSLALTMSKSSAALFDMLENLLEWSRMQRGMTVFEPKLLDLNLTIQQIIQLVNEVARAKHIAIHTDIQGDVIIFADEQMIESTIRNLLSNAIKFTPREGRVTISAKKEADHAIIVSIEDNGIGMNQKILDRLFRIDENVSRKGTDGESSSGLGLMLCKEFIEKHAGTIWVESEVDKGTTFHFRIPAIGKPG